MSKKLNYTSEVATLIVVAFVVMSSVIAMLILKNNPTTIVTDEDVGQLISKPAQRCMYACCDRSATLPPFSYSCPNRRDEE